VGQKETCAKMDIPSGIILGQYCGNEMLESEFDKVYNVTQSIGGTKLCIDAFAGCPSSPLLYINDGRADIFSEVTADDQARINCEFVEVMCNGWPMVLVRTTKPISAGAVLWIYYGPQFHRVLIEKAFVRDKQKKTFRSIEQIDVDLEEDRPLEIEYIDGMRDGMDEDCGQNKLVGVDDALSLTALKIKYYRKVEEHRRENMFLKEALRKANLNYNTERKRVATLKLKCNELQRQLLSVDARKNKRKRPNEQIENHTCAAGKKRKRMYPTPLPPTAISTYSRPHHASRLSSSIEEAAGNRTNVVILSSDESGNDDDSVQIMERSSVDCL